MTQLACGFRIFDAPCLLHILCVCAFVLVPDYFLHNVRLAGDGKEPEVDKNRAHHVWHDICSFSLSNFSTGLKAFTWWSKGNEEIRCRNVFLRCCRVPTTIGNRQCVLHDVKPVADVVNCDSSFVRICGSFSTYLDNRFKRTRFSGIAPIHWNIEKGIFATPRRYTQRTELYPIMFWISN